MKGPRKKKKQVLNTELMNKLELVGIRIAWLKTKFLKWRGVFGIITVIWYERDKEIKAIKRHVIDMENKKQFHIQIFSI